MSNGWGNTSSSSSSWRNAKAGRSSGWGNRDDSSAASNVDKNKVGEQTTGGFARLGNGPCYGWRGVIHVSSADDDTIMVNSWNSETTTHMQGPRNRWGATRVAQKNHHDNDNDDGSTSATILTNDNKANGSPETTASTNHNKTTPNPLAGMPLLSSVESVPKNDIIGWYGNRLAKLNRKRQLLEGGKPPIVVLDKCWYTWSDNGLPHARKFTCIFTCPVSGERFASGSWGNPQHYKRVETPLLPDANDNDETTSNEQEKGNKPKMIHVVWYTKKKLAEHAAARRALDCFSLRDNDKDMTRSRVVCQEKAYATRHDAPPLPPVPLSQLWHPPEIVFEAWPNPQADTPMKEEEDDDDNDKFKKEYKALRNAATAMET